MCLQHEFGIYGGPAGVHILTLLRDLRMPVVTTLHTVLREPNADQRRVMQQLAGLSARLVVMSERGREFLEQIYDVPPEKIDLIPHGIPDMPFVDPNFYKDQFGVEGKNVLLTFGLLSPNKGIEHMLQALPRDPAASFPTRCTSCWAPRTPTWCASTARATASAWSGWPRTWACKKHVIFYNRFVELPKLTEFIGAADMYVTPYLNPAQITSGTLAYAFGCGKAVISTPYWHAEELLADDRGVLVPFGDSEAHGRAICALAWRRAAPPRDAQAGLPGRPRDDLEPGGPALHGVVPARAADAARDRHATVRRLARATTSEFQLPRIKLDHLLRMTDSTGIFQHAVYNIPNFAEGYCTDDNARALMLTVLLEELGHESPRLDRAATTYAAFLHYAFNSRTGRFRNFMTFDRTLARGGRLGRLASAAPIWALGTCVGRSQRRGLQFWAVELFEPALPACVETTSPRAWALALLGIHEYLRRMSGDRLAAQRPRDAHRAADRACTTHNATDDWPWFEDIVTYDNAKLPHALILSGRWTEQRRGAGDRPQVAPLAVRGADLAARAASGPIGVNGFFRRGEEPRRVRPAAARGPRHGVGVHRGLPRDRRRASGSTRPAGRSSGSWAATTWACRCTTPAPAAAATGCTRTASTRTRAPSRRSPCCCRWPK